MSIHQAFLLLVFILLLEPACSSDPETPIETTIITGRISNYKDVSNTKIVKLSSQETGHYFDKEANIGPNGSFRFELSLESSKQFTLMPFHNTYVFLQPGDSVHIELDPNRPRQSTFSGSSRLENEALNAFYSEGYYASYRVPKNILTNYPPDAFLDYSDSLMRFGMENLSRYMADVDPGPQITKSLDALVRNDHYIRLFDYGLSSCSVLNQPKDIELKIEDDFQYYQQIIKSVNNEGDRLVHHSSISSVLDRYLRYLIQYHIQDESFNYNDEPYQKRLLSEIIENVNNDHLKEQMLFRYYSYLTFQHQFDFIDSNFDVWKDHVVSDPLWSIMKAQSDSSKAQSLSAKPLVGYSTSTLFVDPKLKNKILEHRGKIIYLDFWTQWCPPCLSDILASKEDIKEALEEGEIAVLYVAPDEGLEESREFMRSNEIPGDHLYLSSEYFAKIMSSFGNSALPFQLCINRKGEIVAKGNHYRFSLPATQNLFAKL